MTPEDIEIRPETPDDYAPIRLAVSAAFDSEEEADLVEAIRASEHYIPEMALVATIGGEIVGHVMISGATLRSDHGDQTIVMLAPLTVAPAFQRRGIGAALVAAATALADERGEPFVTVEGDPRYYGRLGFEHSVKYGLEINLPDWAPAEAAQVMRLSAYDPQLRGLVVYPPAFDTAD